MQVAASALESSLLKYSAKEYFFRAALCHLCVDSLNAQHAVQRYEEQYPAFADSREAKLVKVTLLFCFATFPAYSAGIVFVCFFLLTVNSRFSVHTSLKGQNDLKKMIHKKEVHMGHKPLCQ